MIRRKIATYLAGKKYIIEILENPTDLSEFNGRPTKRLITGLILMGLSYIMGWPAVAALSVLAAWFREPMIAVIGCPTTYGLSYLVFIVGAWFARAPHYMGTLTRYAMQFFLRKLLSRSFSPLTDGEKSAIGGHAKRRDGAGGTRPSSHNPTGSGQQGQR